MSGSTRRHHPDNRLAAVFLGPWVLGLVLITAVPMVASLVLAFTDYSLIAAPRWSGLDNIRRMIEDARLHHSLLVTLTYVIVSTPLQLAVALAVALVLNTGMRGLALYRSIFYLPSLIGASVAVAILWRQMFGARGLVNELLGRLGFTDLPGWVSDPRSALWTIVLLHVWTFGAPMVIFLAGLRQIPAQYYEAAAVDGASRWTRFVHITLPLLTPIIFFNLVLQTINAFQSFTQAFVVSGGTGSPSDSTLFYTLYLYQRGFGDFDMGYASAMGWVLLLIVAAFTAVNFALSRRWVSTMTDSGPLRLITRVTRHLVLIAVAIVMIYPLLWMIASALRPSDEIFHVPGLLPPGGEVGNYVQGWTALRRPFSTYLLNSTLLVIGCVIGNLVSCALTAYAFARMRFWGRQVCFAVMLGTIMLPVHVVIVPQYILFSQTGWVNTMVPLVLPKFLATDAFFVFLMVQFIRGIPRELDEGARIDGCGHVRIFSRIILPLMTPALATTAVSTTIWLWNDFFASLIYLTSPDKFTVPLALRAFLDAEGSSEWGPMFAMSVLSLLPMFLVFLVGQRFLVRGIATTGLR